MYELLESLASRQDFREYVQEVFKFLYDELGITLDEITTWLNKKVDSDSYAGDLHEHVKNPGKKTRLCNMVYPCNVVPFRGKYSFDQVGPDAEPLVEIDKYTLGEVEVSFFIRSFLYCEEESFGTYMMSQCFSENFKGTEKILKDILGEIQL